MGDYITTAEAAKIIGCNASRVRQLLLDERLRGQRVGRDWFVEKKSVEEYRDSARRPGPQPKNPV